MGFLTGANDDDAEGATTTVTCESCGWDVDEDEIEDGECPECRESEYSGPKYCCGMIYENGEDTCLSCGEPL